jgi:hypothetical protein
MNPINPTTAFSAVIQAFRLGLRDSFTLRALGLLAALWSISALLWLVVFLVFRADIWHAMQTIATFGAAMGVFGTMAAGTLSNAGPVGVVTAAAGAAVSSQVFPDTSAFGAAPFHCVQQKDHLPKESQAARRAFAKFLAYFDETNDAGLSEDEEKQRLRLIQAAIKAGSWRAELSYWLWVANTGPRGDLERSRRVSAELLRMAQGRNPAIVAAAAAQIHDDADGQPTLNSLLRSGLERGSPQVMTSVGGRLAINVPKHRARGLAMLRCAAEQGDVEAYHPLGLTARLEGRWVDAYRIFELGANQGCTRCAEVLGPIAMMRLGVPGSPRDPTGHTPEISSLSAFYAAQFFWQITGLTDLRQLAPPSLQVNLGHEQIMGLIGLEMKESGLKPAPR